MNNFIILTTPRSGSSWLGSLLDDHPDVDVYGELFLHHSIPEKYKDVRQKDPLKFFEYRQQNQGLRPSITHRYLDDVFTSPKQACGFKVMAGQFLKHPELILYCNTFNIKVVYLNRLLEERALSYAVAQHREHFHQLKEQGDEKPITLDSAFIEKFLKRQKMLQNGLNLYMKALNCPIINLAYNDLDTHQQTSLDKVYRFLGIQPHVARSSFQKISEKNYTDIITNYDEIDSILERYR